MEWAINMYNKQHTVNYKVTNLVTDTKTAIPRTTQLSSEVF